MTDELAAAVKRYNLRNESPSPYDEPPSVTDDKKIFEHSVVEDIKLIVNFGLAAIADPATIPAVRELVGAADDASKLFASLVVLAQTDYDSPPEPADKDSWECDQMAYRLSTALAALKEPSCPSKS